MKHSSILTIALAGALAVSACATGHGGKHQADTRPARLLYSPNGEPLNGGPLGRPTCKEAMTGWFNRVNASHSGNISQDEFMVDAKLQFQHMDIDKNGYLVSEELERFRLPYRQVAPYTASSAVPGGSQPSQTSSGSHRHRHGGMGGDTGGGGNSGGGAAHNQDNAADIDPVMSADANFDSRVTQDEFTVHARTVFATLDSDRNNVLSLAEILSLCGQRR